MDTTGNSNSEKKSGMCGCDCKSFSFKDMFKMMKQMKKNKKEGIDCCTMMQNMFNDESAEPETETTK